MLDADQTLGLKLMEQLKMISGFNINPSVTNKPKDILQPPFSSPNLPPKALYNWVGSRLGAVKNLLATLLIYYARPENICPPEIVHILLKMAQVCLFFGVSRSLSISYKNNWLFYI